MGVRLRLRQAQADAGDVVLLYADESEALTHPYLAHAWAEKGADLRVNAPGQSRKVAMMGALDAATGELIVSTSPTKTSADVIRMLRRLDWRYGPKPGCDRRPVVLLWDNGPIHTSRATRTALAERPWISVEWLPRYAPELNEVDPFLRTALRPRQAWFWLLSGRQFVRFRPACPNTVHFAIRMAALKSMRVVGCGVRGRNG